MKHLLTITIAFALSITAFGGCTTSSESSSSQTPQASPGKTAVERNDAKGDGAAAAKVTQIGADGLRQLLAVKRPLLINFWATWCEPCRDEFPDLVAIDRDYRSHGLEFITVSLDDAAEIERAVPQFLREMRATMPTYLLNVADPETAITAVDPEWSGALPATFLFDESGRIVYKHFGRINPAELRAAIERTLKR
ncbi:MAG: hypothetical protein C4334_02255 [Pyrinomonas sp.]|uniref:TlpA family protein disulfide reductase n=1 Tax=Pyrinomonas sp. TaxID=2080306 RepID=UPI00331C1BBA